MSGLLFTPFGAEREERLINWGNAFAPPVQPGRTGKVNPALDILSFDVRPVRTQGDSAIQSMCQLLPLGADCL